MRTWADVHRAGELDVEILPADLTSPEIVGVDVEVRELSAVCEDVALRE